MKTRRPLILAVLLLAGCAGSPALKPARAARADLRQAEASNAAATRSVDQAQTDAQRIDDKAVVLQGARWIITP